MRVSLYQEPWMSNENGCSDEMEFCLGPLVSASEKTIIKCNGRKLPIYSEYNKQTAKEIKYSRPISL